MAGQVPEIEDEDESVGGYNYGGANGGRPSAHHLP